MSHEKKSRETLEEIAAKNEIIARHVYETAGFHNGFSWKATAALRWRKPNQDELIALMESVNGKSDCVLQQAWQCIETGEVNWRDIPVET